MKGYIIKISDKAFRELYTQAQVLHIPYAEGASLEQAFLMRVMQSLKENEVPEIQLRSEKGE